MIQMQMHYNNGVCVLTVLPVTSCNIQDRPIVRNDSHMEVKISVLHECFVVITIWIGFENYFIIQLF